jgi:hypothetical protein
MQKTVIQQGLHEQRNAASFKQIFGDIAAAGFQIRDIWCSFEDLGDVEEVESPALMGNGGQMKAALVDPPRAADHRATFRGPRVTMAQGALP